MINKIINWFKSLFHKVPDEILELKKIIAKVEKEKQQLQKDLDMLLNRKRINKKTVANAKRKLTRTKNEVKKMETAYESDDVESAEEFLRKFSKSK